MPRGDSQRFKNWNFVIKESLSIDLPYRLHSIAAYCIWHFTAHGPKDKEKYNIYGYIQFYSRKTLTTLKRKFNYDTDWTPTTRFLHRHPKYGKDWSKYECFTYGTEQLLVQSKLMYELEVALTHAAQKAKKVIF